MKKLIKFLFLILCINNTTFGMFKYGSSNHSNQNTNQNKPITDEQNALKTKGNNSNKIISPKKQIIKPTEEKK